MKYASTALNKGNLSYTTFDRPLVLLSASSLSSCYSNVKQVFHNDNKTFSKSKQNVLELL